MSTTQPIAAESTDTRRTPSDFLRQVLGRTVCVKLNTGEIYRGTLACLDPRMNIALENTEECVDGKAVRNFGDACIRGNNVLYISAVSKGTKRPAAVALAEDDKAA
eukprot:Protomagalhaensia_wolfi_Nauph_80__4075@NODE_4133_length_632_cov_505_025295_g3278_i0_p1_GENE_NODE_4133_length_632_cov_505_025295_g3278_i0NODE_4133_length_632_cov_505_025295_g3278_i0_p1_ORF_typecomplete_len106_score5_54LSM/PF01423_22/1_1e19SMATX/PF14438_6/5_6e06DUF2642/PF10842_8/0_2_NODE_4133_length_632_cov_505_025295_g3278_i0161478